MAEIRGMQPWSKEAGKFPGTFLRITDPQILAKDPDINRPAPEALAKMRARGGRWAVYQNHDLGSRDIGRLTFLQYGPEPERTFKTPPMQYPDTPAVGLGWRYLHVGFVDLQSGEIVEQEPEVR